MIVGLGIDLCEVDRIEAMLARPELAFGPEPPGRDELAQLVERAW